MAKIYTKTGDKGETGLIGGSRVPKNHIRIEAVGSLDEANAELGMVVSQMTNSAYREELEHMQGMLFELGAVLADPQARHSRPDDSDVERLEQLIDHLSVFLPPLTAFILPGGHPRAAQLHVARTAVRRAERRVITVSQHQAVPDVVIRYLNRLSDFLFTLARLTNTEHGQPDKLWHPIDKASGNLT